MEALLGSMPSCAKTRCRRGAGGVQLEALGFTWARGRVAARPEGDACVRHSSGLAAAQSMLRCALEN